MKNKIIAILSIAIIGLTGCSNSPVSVKSVGNNNENLAWAQGGWWSFMTNPSLVDIAGGAISSWAPYGLWGLKQAVKSGGNYNKNIFVLNSSGQWTQLQGCAIRIDVGKLDGIPWIVNPDGKIYYLDPALGWSVKWQVQNFIAKDIGVGDHGNPENGELSVWATDNQQNIWKFYPQKPSNQWIKLGQGLADRIAVRGTTPYTINLSDGRVWRLDPNSGWVPFGNTNNAADICFDEYASPYLMAKPINTIKQYNFSTSSWVDVQPSMSAGDGGVLTAARCLWNSTYVVPWIITAAGSKLMYYNYPLK
jgi:hypothetical protein